MVGCSASWPDVSEGGVAAGSATAWCRPLVRSGREPTIDLAVSVARIARIWIE